MKHPGSRYGARLAVIFAVTLLAVGAVGLPTAGRAAADSSVPVGSGYTLTAYVPVISGSTVTGKATLTGSASTSEQVQVCLQSPSNDSWSTVSGSCKTVTQTAATTTVTTNAVTTTPGTEYRTWGWAWQSGASNSTTSGAVAAALSIGPGATVGSGYTLAAHTPVASGPSVVGTATLYGTAQTSEQLQACLWSLSGSTWTQDNASCKTVMQTAATASVATNPVALVAGRQYKTWVWGSQSGISNTAISYVFTAPSSSTTPSSRVAVGTGYTLTAYAPVTATRTMVGSATLSGAASISQQVQACLQYLSGTTWIKVNSSCNTVTRTAATTTVTTNPVALTSGTQYQTWAWATQSGVSNSTVTPSTTASVLSATPYMGFDTYYALGGNINDASIRQLATQMQQNGLAQSGYNLIWLDWGWSSGTRDAGGNLVADTTKWPSGINGLTTYLHGLGFKVGIYTDAGASGCSNSGVGSLGHYQQDANTFATWGIDAVKVDFCGAGEAGLLPETQLSQFAAAVTNNSSHRPMVLNLCVPWLPGQVGEPESQSSYYTYLWANNIAQSWRTGPDINFGGNTPQDWSYVMRNLQADAAHPEVAGPGHWSDPDYLDFYGLTDAQARAQLTMWSMLAAPLMLSTNLATQLTPAQLADLKNPAVIAIDQDALGSQGTKAFTQGAGGEVWFKRLSGNRLAVALLSTGSSSVNFQVTAAQMGLSGTYTQSDVWANTTTRTTSPITATVGPTSAKLYIVQQ
jgi:hypothetical protein